MILTLPHILTYNLVVYSNKEYKELLLKMKKITPILLIITICLLSLLLVSCSGDKYTVNFETNGGSAISSINIDKEKSSFTLPETPPIKEGHIFVGWYFDNGTFSLPATYEEILAKLSSKVKSITIYAKWTAAVIEQGTYLINFETNGGSGGTQITIEQSATTFALPSSPTKPNFSFEGWYFDNGTFTQAADIASILSRLSASAPYVTVFAKWGNPYPVAFDTLAASLTVFYKGINTPPSKPSDTDIERLEQLQIELAFSQDKTMLEHYNYVDGILLSWSDETFQTYQTYRRYCYLADLKNYEGLSPELQQELDGIIQGDNALSSYGEENDRYNYVTNFLNIYSQYEGFTQAKLDLYKEYRGKARVALKYNEYSQKLISYEEYIDSFIKSIASNDIRLEKIKNLSSFLAFYDYSALLSEYLDEANQTFFALNPDYFVNFLLELRQTCELTKEDVGLISYKLIIAYFNAALADINQQILDLNAEIDKYKDENNSNMAEYLEQLNKTLLFLQDNKVSLEKLSGELSLSYITEAIDLIFGVTEIISNNNIIEILSGNSDENAPTLGEVATVISSLKTACDQLIATYTAQDFTNSLDSLSVILTALETENSYIGEFATFLKSILPNDPIASVSKLSNILNLFTEPTLDVFFNRELDSKTNTYNLNLESNNLYENLAILEAKIITILTGGAYSQQNLSLAYDTFISSISAFLPHGLSFYDITLGNGQLSNTENTLSKYLAELIFDNLKAKFVISEERYAAILSVANNEFITLQNPQIPQNLDSLIFTSECQNYLEYFDIVLDIKSNYNSLYSGEKGNLLLNAQTLSLLLYATDADLGKLNSYNQYISNLSNIYSDKNIVNERMLYAYAFDGLFKENCFTVEEISQIFELLLYKGVEYFEDNLELLGINGAELNTLIDDLLSDEDTDKKDIAFSLVISLRLSSELAICFNKDFLEIATLAQAIGDATEILGRYAINDIDKWNASTLAVKGILDVLKNTEGISELAAFIDYFVTAPSISLTKLSQILGLCDIDTLNVFMNEEIDVENSSTYLIFDSENEYFIDNLAILEAKILNILIDENNLGGILNTFTHISSFIKANLLESLLGSLDENEFATFETLIDDLIQKLSTEFTIDSSRYTAIVTLSEKPFISYGDHLTADDYETVIICNIYNKYAEYEQSFQDIIDILDGLYLNTYFPLINFFN